MIQPINSIRLTQNRMLNSGKILPLFMLLFFQNLATSQIDFVVESASYNPVSITVGATSTLETTVDINSTQTGLGGSMGVGCLEITISLPALKQYVPQGGAAGVQNMGFATKFNWTYSPLDNTLYGYNNVALVHGDGGSIFVTVVGQSVTNIPVTTTVNANDFLNCSNSNDGSNDSKSATLSVTHSVALTCLTDTAFFYDVTAMGIVITAADLYLNASTTQACQPLTFFLDDGVRREQGSLSYGLNDLFNPPMCIILTAKDDCGDSLNCKVNISIQDTLPPQIFCPLPDTVCEMNQVPLPFTTIAAFELAGGDIIEETFSPGVPVPPSYFSLIDADTTTIGCNRTVARKYRIRDYWNNADTCTQFIVVKNANGISCGQPIMRNTDAGKCTALVSPSVTNPFIHPNCEIDTIIINSPVVNNIYPLGTTNILFSVVNVCNDTFRCTRQVIVRDSFAPEISCPLNVTVQCEAPVAAANYTNFVMQGGLAVDNCMIDQSSLYTSQSVVGNTCPRTVTRRYIISDQSGNKDTCTQIIYIHDTTKPMMTDPKDITVGTDNGVCQATISLVNPLTSDNCTAPLTITRSPAGNVFAIGATSVIWTVTDACGNTASTQQIINVFDDEAPELTCKDSLVVNLSYGDNYLLASSLVLNTNDNCPGPLTIKGRRMETVCAANATQFADTIRYCCADVGLERMVTIRVTDSANNSQTCMVKVKVMDKLKPVIVEPLPNITISCDYPLDLSDLEAFGSIVFFESDRSEIEIEDVLFVAPKYDGFVDDNCPESLKLTTLPIFDQRLHNHTGNIVRRFVVTDGGGNTVSAQQVITIVDADPLTLNDIKWPRDTFYYDCTSIPPDTSVTGGPIFNNDDICTLPVSSFDDQIFDEPNSGCVFIKRKWKVIDWAQYVSNTNIGIWYHTQNIHLRNTKAPEFVSSCADRVICALNSDCDGTVSLGAHATDDCTDLEDLVYGYKIDYNNNGSTDVSAAGDTFSLKMARGIHRITWSVEDRCGNDTTCSFTVTVKECKAPIPVCMYGLSTNLEDNGTGGTAAIWASDFNNQSYDNCTPKSELRYSFSANTNNKSLTLMCKDTGTYHLSMWVTDNDGNQSRCNTFILVTDHKNLCPSTGGGNSIPTVSVAGRIATEDNAMIKDALLSISGDSVVTTAKTDLTGTFLISNLEMYNDYTLKPNYDTHWADGISTLDLVLIQRHILGSKKLESSYKIIAADANNDQKVTASDLVALRKLILGIDDNIEGNTSWRFVEKQYVFADPSAPWNFPEEIDLHAVDANMMNSDFVAVKTGDVNGTVSNLLSQTDSELRTPQKDGIVVAEDYFEEARYVNVPVTLAEGGELRGLQLGFKFDTDLLEFTGIMEEQLTLSKEEYTYNVVKGELKMAIVQKSPLSVRSGGVLFILQFKSKKSGKLSQSIAMIENGFDQAWVNTSYEQRQLLMRIENGMEALTVQQNTPNPFVDQTDVKFFVAEDAKVEISIFDNTGSRIYSQVRPYGAGVNQLRIDKEQLGDRKGVFFLHIATGERKEIKKLLRMN
ncbi:MAG: HYR domain-containing protein [Saprospiraceae bacterium]|nr:HYR domain-containing protein [Saprospiraceae bacterium]